MALKGTTWRRGRGLKPSVQQQMFGARSIWREVAVQASCLHEKLETFNRLKLQVFFDFTSGRPVNVPEIIEVELSRVNLRPQDSIGKLSAEIFGNTVETK